MRLLHDAGMDVNTAVFDSGETALHVAARCGSAPDILTGLLAAGAHVNARDRRLRTPLHVAARRDGVENVSILLSAGADVNAGDDHQVSALHIASATGQVNIVKVLLEFGANVHAVNRSNRTPLFGVHCGKVVLR